MQRRALLAALGIGLAGFVGCTADPLTGGTASDSTRTAGDSSPSDETPASSPTSHRPQSNRDEVSLDDGGFDGASIVDLETVDRTYALAPQAYRGDDGAEVRTKFSRTATADHPATLVASLKNANHFENTFRLDWLPPFGGLFSGIPHAPGDRWTDGELTYRSGLALVPTADHDLVDEAPAVERGSNGQWRLAERADRWLPERVRLDPDQVIRGEYAVVGRADGDGKGRPTGVYEFNRAQERPVEITVWATDAPGPADSSRFAGASLPALPNAEESPVAWYHEADASTPSYVAPSAERARLPAAVDFTFVNHARESTRCGHWSLYKLHDGSWYRIGPWARTADCRIVRPGGAKRWTLHAYHGDAIRSQGAAVYDYLGGGRYAAVAGYGHATPRSAALVELVADPLRVVATDDVEATWDDRTVTLTSSRWEDEESSSAALTLTRVDDADRTIVAEQVMRERYRGLRNLLAYVEVGVEREPDRVVLRTSERVAERTVGYDSQRVRFVFGGQAYEVTAAW